MHMDEARALPETYEAAPPLVLIGKSFNNSPTNFVGATLSNACFSVLLVLVLGRTTTMVASQTLDKTSASARGSNGGESSSTQSNALFKVCSNSGIRADFTSSKGSTGALPAGIAQTLCPEILYMKSRAE